MYFCLPASWTRPGSRDLSTRSAALQLQDVKEGASTLHPRQTSVSSVMSVLSDPSEAAAAVQVSDPSGTEQSTGIRGCIVFMNSLMGDDGQVEVSCTEIAQCIS